MERDPLQIIGRDPEILVVGTEDFEQAHDDINVDVEVTVNGTRWSATFFTIRNLQTLLDRWSQTGECADGTYIWASGMIVVRELSAEVIRTTVRDLIASDEFSKAFSRLDDD